MKSIRQTVKIGLAFLSCTAYMNNVSASDAGFTYTDSQLYGSSSLSWAGGGTLTANSDLVIMAPIALTATGDIDPQGNTIRIVGPISATSDAIRLTRKTGATGPIYYYGGPLLLNNEDITDAVLGPNVQRKSKLQIDEGNPVEVSSDNTVIADTEAMVVFNGGTLKATGPLSVAAGVLLIQNSIVDPSVFTVGLANDILIANYSLTPAPTLSLVNNAIGTCAYFGNAIEDVQSTDITPNVLQNITHLSSYMLAVNGPANTNDFAIGLKPIVICGPGPFEVTNPISVNSNSVPNTSLADLETAITVLNTTVVGDFENIPNLYLYRQANFDITGTVRNLSDKVILWGGSIVDSTSNPDLVQEITVSRDASDTEFGVGDNVHSARFLISDNHSLGVNAAHVHPSLVSFSTNSNANPTVLSVKNIDGKSAQTAWSFIGAFNMAFTESANNSGEKVVFDSPMVFSANLT